MAIECLICHLLYYVCWRWKFVLQKKDILFSQSLTLFLLVIKNYLEKKMSLYVHYV